MSSTRKTSGHPSPAYNLSAAEAAEGATTPAAATTEAAEAAEAVIEAAAAEVVEAVEAVEAAGGGGSPLADGAIDIARGSDTAPAMSTIPRRGDACLPDEDPS
jgi:hypothetical protein